MLKRVLLIDPPQTRPPDLLIDKVRIGLVAPLGLAYIGAVLEQNGIEVKILDCTAEGQLQGLRTGAGIRYGLTDYQIGKNIEQFNPDIVGVSCLFSNKAWDAHNVCAIAKEINSRIITVMGGAHPTAVPEETLADKNVDLIVSGDGEYEMLDIARDEMNFRRRPDLNSLPLPARHLLNMPKYLSGESPHSGLKRTPVATITTSRGCPGHCSFCAIRCLWGKEFRIRSPENVLAEIEHLADTYHIKELHFEDDCLTANKRRAMSIFQGIIDRKLDLTLNSPSGLAVFAMDEDLMDKMVEAGYYSFSFAIESGSPQVLKDLIHKKVDLDKAKRLVAYARSIGVKTKAFFILGYPGETKETINQTVDYAYNLGADWSLFFPATPLPGTELLETCQKNGWLADPDLDYRYYFSRANVITPEFDPEYVISLKEEANERINFRENINLRTGNYQNAREDFEEITRLYPDLKIAQEASRRIR